MVTNTMQKLWKMPDAAWLDKIERGVTAPRTNRVIQLVHDHLDLRGKRGFDFGCGEGVLMRRFTDMGASVEGCDPSEKLIEHAGQHARVGDVSALPSYPSNAYDFFLMFQVVSFLNKPGEFSEAMREARRMLKPNGLLLITIANGRCIEFNVARRPQVTDPLLFKSTLFGYGFEEIAHDFDSCLLPRWKRIAIPWRRNERFMQDEVLATMSERHKLNKAANYISLSRKIAPA